MFVFDAPKFLFLLPLAALPLLLHLLSRMRPPVLRLPTMRFLLHAPQPQEGRRKWQDLLLLAVRTALVALFVLALAAPRRRPDPAESASGRQAPALAVLLDSSASMHPHAEEARTAARTALEEHPGWEVALFAFDRQATPLQPQDLPAWRPGFAEGAPADALQTCVNWLFSRPRAEQHKLLIISDLQQSNWNHALPSPPAGTQVEIRSVAQETPSRNVAVTGVQAAPISATQLRLRVSWHNWSDLPQERTLVAQVGQHRSELAIRLPPQSAGSTALVSDWSDDALRGLAMLLPADDFPPDDRHYFWAQREPPAQILLLLPDAAEDMQIANELEFFLVRAMTAERDDLPGRFAAESLGLSALSLVDLRHFALVFLAGCAERLGTAELARLRDYQAAGGGLVAIPGNAPVAAWRNLSQSGLLSSAEQGISRQPTGLGELPEKTLLAGIFPAGAASDLHLFSIRQILRVTPAPEDTLLLRTLDNHPALLRHDPPEGGPLYAFTFPFHHDATDFPLTQSFLPVLREICAEATRGHSETLRLKCGEPFPVLNDFDGTPLQPDMMADSTSPGLARLGRHPVEINLPQEESSPRTAAASEVLRALENHSASAEERPTQTATPSPADRGSDLRG
ncbi:MAG: BatA domain-containing protein [Victivallales bacterium]|nr:BatA domain-containing protein [Victivallales bacterium]